MAMQALTKTVRAGLVALFVVVLAIAAGCGSSTSPGTLTVSIEAEPQDLDPSFSGAVVDRQVMASLYDKLVDIDGEGNIVPMLARDWEISEDGKTYTFELREGVEFHDGTPFNAEAVKFNLERYQKEDSARSGELALVEEVEAPNPTRVRVTLKEPFSPFLSILTDRAGMMVSPAAMKKHGDGFSNNPVGAGPFRFVERVRGDHITVEKFGGYWQEGLPKLERVVYRGIEDTGVQLANLRSGELDVIDSIPPNEVQSLEEEDEFKVVNEPGLGFQGIYLNTARPPFDDANLRRAVYTMVDREAIVSAVLRDAGGVAGNSPFAPTSLAYGESDEFERGTVEEAKELLAEAGEPDGFSFTLKLDTVPVNQQIGQVIQNTLKPAGIEVELERVEHGAMLEQWGRSDFEALFNGFSGRIDPDQNIHQYFATDGDSNYTGYSNPEVDRLLDEAAREEDPERRKALYDEVMRIMHREVPYVYLYHENDQFAMRESVEGFEYTPDGILRTVSMSKRQEG